MCWLNQLVVYDQFVGGSLVVRGIIRLMCVLLGTMLQLCVCTLDGRDLHVAHCGLVSGRSSARTW